MKKAFVLAGLLTGISLVVFAQNKAISPFADRKAVVYRSNDSIGQLLDYSNTVCDTLLYGDTIVLLEQSPLLQLDGVPELVRRFERPVAEDGIYNGQRGYTATWEIRDNRLLLTGISACGESYYLPPSWLTGPRNTYAVDLSKPMDARAAVGQINFVHALSKGSFYPRFLRTGVVFINRRISSLKIRLRRRF